MTSTDSTPSVAATASTVDPTSKALLELAVGAADDLKAEDIRVLELAEISDFTNWFVICSGSSDRQVKAIAESMLDKLRENGTRPLHVEGMRLGTWVLLDFGGEMVIHVFQDETRRFYDLDRLWSDAPDYTDAFRTGSETPPSDEAPDGEAATEPDA